MNASTDLHAQHAKSEIISGSTELRTGGLVFWVWITRILFVPCDSSFTLSSATSFLWSLVESGSCTFDKMEFIKNKLEANLCKY